MAHQSIAYLGDTREQDPIDIRTILQTALQSALADSFSFRMMHVFDEHGIETNIELGLMRALARITGQLRDNADTTIGVTVIPLIEPCDWRLTFRILAVAGNGRSVGYAATKLIPMPVSFGNEQRGKVWRREITLAAALGSALCFRARPFAYLHQRGPLCGLSDGKFSDQQELIGAITAAVSQLS